MPFLLLYWKYLVAAAIVATLAVAYNWHVDKLIDTAVTKAVTERDGEWRKSEAKAIADADSRARAVEAKHAQDLQQLRGRYQRDIANAKVQHDKDVASANSGDLQLRIPAALCGSSGDGAKVAGSSSGSDGPETIQLPPTLTGDLFALADDADAIADQLTACQAVITSDRKEQ